MGSWCRQVWIFIERKDHIIHFIQKCECDTPWQRYNVVTGRVDYGQGKLWDIVAGTLGHKAERRRGGEIRNNIHVLQQCGVAVSTVNSHCETVQSEINRFLIIFTSTQFSHSYPDLQAAFLSFSDLGVFVELTKK